MDEFKLWLNPRGNREGALLKALRTWHVEIESGMKRRRVIMGLDKGTEEEEAGPRRRVTRRGGEEEGFLGWKVCPVSPLLYAEDRELLCIDDQNKRAL